MIWFKRKRPFPQPEYRIEHKSERDYREERIREISRLTGKTLEETAAFADLWMVHEVSARYGDDEDLHEAYIATPLWDDEWLLSRASFDTWDEARAYVSEVGGSLMES